MSIEPLLVIVGPTGSGKTELGIRIAERSQGEIVSADSVQVYRGFDIGSGKPSPSEQARARHHLLGITEPLDAMDAARWAELAQASIQEIRARSRRPIVCGGSFLWVRALTHGLAEAPPADLALRQQHRQQVANEGPTALHAKLTSVDSASAARLNAQDVLRVSRALEVFQLTGKPLSQWHAEHGFQTARHAARLIGIRHEPAELDARLRRRVQQMLAAGWLDEVRALLEQGYVTARAMGSVGYKQVASAVQTGTSIDLQALEDQIVRVTRIFVRRQRTWLREQNVTWLTPDEADAQLDTL